jgi:SAM-dependent methyltransferase
MFHPNGPTFWELAVQAFSSTQRGYDLLAPKFDYTPFRTPNAVLQRVAECLAPRGPFARVLDVCCGTGAAMGVLRTLCRDCLVGVDFSAGMLAEARRRAAVAPGVAAPAFVQADALAMPFDGAFDLAVSFGAFGHFLPRDQLRLAQEIHRALRPGGHFAFVAAPRPPWSSASYWAARAFNAAMHVRNLVVRPPFIMYYLTFDLCQLQVLFERSGFKVEVCDVDFPRPWTPLRLVLAKRSALAKKPC